MPALPEFDATAAPDGHHAVRAPGGYEWWYFDADLADGNHVVAILLDGFVFHPTYLRRHFRYLAAPTKHAPAFADEFACAYLCVYRGGRIWQQFMTQFPPGTLRASASGPDVTLGENTLRRAADGTLRLSLAGHPWHLTWHGPKTRRSQALRAELAFAPELTHPPQERAFLSRAMTGAEHRWVIADPRCRVSARVTLDGETYEQQGVGYHDHNYGTAPIGPGLKRWIWGRAFDADTRATTTFHLAVPRDPDLPTEVHLVRADEDGSRAVRVAHADADWSRRTPLGLAYPARVALGDELVLQTPRVIDSAPFYMRLVYDDARARGRPTLPALCEAAYPHRLRWPVVGRMIELSFDKRKAPA